MNAAAGRREITRVAVGVLVRADGSVLLADRPAGKPFAGYWEFPGGKIEPGEAVAAALKRELHEELGIDVGPAAPWICFEFDYPHAYVQLHFCQVHTWSGSPHGREGQELRFVDPWADLPAPLLPAAIPAMRWLRLPRKMFVARQHDGLISATSSVCGPHRSPPYAVIVDADWQEREVRKAAKAQRKATGGILLFASGLGALDAVDVDGVVVSANSLGNGICWPEAGWRGVWVDSVEGLQAAGNAGCDFVLAESPGVVAHVRAQAASVPLLVPSRAWTRGGQETIGYGHGQWIDLRSNDGLATS